MKCKTFFGINIGYSWQNWLSKNDCHCQWTPSVGNAYRNGNEKNVKRIEFYPNSND